MQPDVASDPLLSPGDLAELDRLRRHLSLRSASEGQGAQMSRRHGQSPEFVDHRGYSPGDDPRRIDWNVMARSEQVVIKRFRAEEEAAVRIAVDVSPSMGFGTPPKLSLARRVAAAVAYLALVDGERAQIGTLGVRDVEWTAATRGRGRYGAIAKRLEFVREERGVQTAEATVDARVAELIRRAGRSGVLVLLTDALDPSGDLDAWPRAIQRARAGGHDVRVVQILAAEELDPPWDGDLALVDLEDEHTVDVTFDAAARVLYAARLEALVHALREGCRRAKATYVRARSDEATLAVIRRLASGGIE